MAQTMEAFLDRTLPGVRMPGRYLGDEVNSVHKNPSRVKVRVAVCFPDLYEIGMSHLGLHVVTHLLNRRDDCWAERVFAVGLDLEKALRAAGQPLFSLESRTPLGDFDLLAFSLQYELSFTGILQVLDLAGIPLLSRDRGERAPIVIAGGHGAYTPEPVAGIVDAFFLGDAEGALEQLIDTYLRLRRRRLPRRELLRALQLECAFLYVPSLYEPRYDTDGAYAGLHPLQPGLPDVHRAAACLDFENAPVPTAPPIPNVRTVHERINVELMRGCVQGCRFCQAGMIKRPTRIRSVARCLRIARETYENTGLEEISLNSLSTSDYPNLKDLLTRLADEFRDRRVGLSVPSLRVNEQVRVIPSILNQVRKTGLTFAPEVATDRLRRIVNKNITNDELYAGVREAYRQGWPGVKLYVMIGIPGERMSDVEGIVELAERCSEIRCEETGKGAGRVTATVSVFVPKGHTPFQWAAMADLDAIARKREHLRHLQRSRAVRLKVHDAGRSFLEAVFSRGDRKLTGSLLRAYRLGARLDAWDEHFDRAIWERAFREEGIDPFAYSHRERGEDEPLPWDHVDCGVQKRYLLREWYRAKQERETAHCFDTHCNACGINSALCYPVWRYGRPGTADTKESMQPEPAPA